MKKKYLVYGAIATIGAVLFYLWKKGKTDQAKEDQEKLDVESGTPRTESANVANTSTLSSTTTSGVPVGLNVTRFQNWIWNNVEGKLKPVSENPKTYQSILCSNACTFDTGVDGSWGTNTSKAWGKYGKYWDVTKNQPNAEGIKTFGSTSTTSSPSTDLVKLNKDTMDKLYMSWGGNTSAKKGTGSAGRTLQVFFEVGGQYFMAYKWSIIFFEYKSGSSEPTYAITDGSGKSYQSGYFSFNGTTYRFRATTGAGAGKRTAISTNLVASLNLLTDRTTSLA
jgi:hypothetical protein